MNSKNKKSVTPLEVESIEQTDGPAIRPQTDAQPAYGHTGSEVRVNGGNQANCSTNGPGQGSEQRETNGPTVDPLEEMASECDKLKEQLLRTAADFDNFRKRSRRDIDDAKRRGKEETIRDLLPVFDSLERATEAAKEAKDIQSIVDGVTMVLKLFEDTGDRMGIKRVAAVGERFDPAVHDAIQELESTQVPPGTVIAEVTPGYRLGEQLLRAAIVVVARAPRANTRSEAESGSSGENSEEGAS